MDTKTILEFTLRAIGIIFLGLLFENLRRQRNSRAPVQGGDLTIKMPKFWSIFGYVCIVGAFIFSAFSFFQSGNNSYLFLIGTAGFLLMGICFIFLGSKRYEINSERISYYTWRAKHKDVAWPDITGVDFITSSLILKLHTSSETFTIDFQVVGFDDLLKIIKNKLPNNLWAKAVENAERAKAKGY